MRRILLFVLLFCATNYLRAQTCLTCPGGFSFNQQTNIMSFLSYPCEPGTPCLLTGTYSGQVFWYSELSSGGTGWITGITVSRDVNDIVTIVFPAGVVIADLMQSGINSQIDLKPETGPYTSNSFAYNTEGGVFSPDGSCNCALPITINSTTAGLNSDGSCTVKFNATVSNASLMKSVYLQRKVGNGQYINVAYQDISGFVNNGGVHNLSLVDGYIQRVNNQALYRLRFDDINGRVSYSREISVYSTCTPNINPPINCSGAYLSGVDSLCNAIKGSVTLINPPLNSSVVWSVTPNDQSIVGMAVERLDRVQLYRKGAGNAVVSAYIPGCNLTLTKNIQVTSIPLARLTNTSNNQSSTLSLNTSVTAGNYRINLNCPTCTNVTWTGSRPLSPTNGNQTNFSLVSGNAWVRATGNNACGPFTRTYNFYVRSGYGFTVTPNPSGGLTMLAADQGTTIKEVRVFDQIGREYFKKAYPNGVERAQIDLSSLKGGFYLIQINNGQESKVQQLVIKK